MVMHRLGACGGLLLSVALASVPALLAAEDGHEVTTKLMVVSISLPSGSNLVAADELPDAVTKLLSQGWQITQTAVVDKTSDGSRANVLLTLSLPRVSFTGGNPHLRFPGFPGLPGGLPGMNDAHGEGDQASAPGAGVPQSPADKGTLVVHWGDGGTSTIIIGDAHGVRSQAHVETKDSHGGPAADYDATAFKDQKGDIEIDGRGAPMTKSSPGYSPDSFLIHTDGHIDIEDDSGTHDHAVLDGSQAQNQPAPATPAHGAPPTTQRQL